MLLPRSHMTRGPSARLETDVTDAHAHAHARTDEERTGPLRLTIVSDFI